mgnify:CR=1 FL=1
MIGPTLRSTNARRHQEAVENLDSLAAVCNNLTHLMLVRDLRKLTGEMVPMEAGAAGAEERSESVPSGGDDGCGGEAGAERGEGSAAEELEVDDDRPLVVEEHDCERLTCIGVVQEEDLPQPGAQQSRKIDCAQLES